MAVFTVRLIATYLLHHVPHIVLMGPKKQMVGIHAAGNIAFMKNM